MAAGAARTDGAGRRSSSGSRRETTRAADAARTGAPAGRRDPAGAAADAAVPFPSLAWCQRLADCMNANRARQEQLGYVDCVAGFKVFDGKPVTYQITFEEYAVVDVREAGPLDADRADFTLEATLATWREMITNIAAGNGRPDLTHTLNHLSHFGTPIFLRADDPLRRDMYFRFNQSLQEFVNASASFPTAFPAGE
jgi:hypothetical protein